jgi:serine/threonine protein kinase
MERLVDINIETAAEYIPEIKNAIHTIHQCGIIVQDISPSNIMINQQGDITIIDFGRAEYIGESIPSRKITGTNPAIKIYSVNADDLALDRTLCRCCPFKADSHLNSP